MAPSIPPHDPLTDGGFETLCGHYGEHRLAHGGAAAPPLYQSSTFVYPDAEAFERRHLPTNPYFDYTRQSNPTTAMLEVKLAALEHGEWARCYGSGMGAITGAVGACLAAGSHIVAVDNCYPPTRTYLEQYLSRFGVTTTFVRGTNPDDFIACLRDDTRIVYLESPTWGRLEVLEVAAIAEAARARGATVVFDNSWATPYFQNPLDLGCDIVVHSMSKYIGGHSDVLGGVAIGRSSDLGRRIKEEGELVGAVLDPFAAWLHLRSLRTLAVRMEQHERSGLEIARMLADDSRVQRVLHPGLPSHEGHEAAKEQMRGYGGVFAFALAEQSREATHRFINRLRVFHIGCGWGGAESLAIGGTLFDRNSTKPLWLIRLHVGLETAEDLLSDVRRALED